MSLPLTLADPTSAPNNTPAAPSSAPNVVRYSSWWTHAATCAVVVHSVSTVPLSILLAATAGLYLLSATLGLVWVERAVGPRRLALHFSLMGLLLASLLMVTQGRAWLAAMPLLSQVVLLVSPYWALGLGLVLFRVVWGSGAPPHACALDSVGDAEFLRTFVDVAGATLFVVAFSVVARREMLWRIRAEHLGAEVAVANEHLRAGADAMAEASRLEERNRMAREVHDGLGHYLTAIHMQLEAARARHAAAPQTLLASLQRVQGLARQGLDDVRQSVALLRSSEPELSLAERLEQLADPSSFPGLQVKVELEGATRSLSSSQQHTLLRVAQEALTNVRRHAAATAVLLRLTFREEDVVLQVDDDGRGPKPAQEGFGLTGIKERIQLLRGEVEFGPGPQGGFRLRVVVPS